MASAGNSQVFPDYTEFTQEQIDALPPEIRASIVSLPKAKAATPIQPSTPETIMMQTSPGKANIFQGEKQPDPKERLAQAKIFLSDEDHFRYLNFQQKLGDIEAYVAFLEEINHQDDKRLLKDVKEMIVVHKQWIARATLPPPMRLKFPKYDFKNRILDQIKDPKRRKLIRNIKAPAISREMLPGPALFLASDNPPVSVDPFIYTKKFIQILRNQDSIAANCRREDSRDDNHNFWYVPAPVNYNGPYMPTFKSRKEELTLRHDRLLDLVHELGVTKDSVPNKFRDRIIAIINEAELAGLEDDVKGAKALTKADLRQIHDINQPDLVGDPKVVEEAARKLGSNIASLRKLIAASNESDGGNIPLQALAIQNIKDQVKSRLPTSLIDLAQTIDPKGRLSEQEAGRLIQTQIITEGNRDWEPNTPDLCRIWAFAASRKTQKEFFSLDRWPLELQTEARRKEIRESGAVRLEKAVIIVKMKKTDKKPTKVAKDPKETYIHGETIFPFGETPFQEARLSAQLEKDLANDPGFAELYSKNQEGEKVVKKAKVSTDPYALPEIPDGMFAWAKTILGKRKRDGAAEDPSGASEKGPNSGSLVGGSQTTPDTHQSSTGGKTQSDTNSMAGTK